MTAPGAFAAFVRTRITPLVVPLFLRFAAARRLMFRTVSQIGLSYPDSSLSVGRAGEITSGDRLPWVPNSNGVDNFASLSSLAWQAHVYGEPRVSAKLACAELQLPMHVFAWTRDAERAGIQRSTFYLVRPNGYIAFVDADGSATGLRTYLTQREITPEPRQGA